MLGEASLPSHPPPPPPSSASWPSLPPRAACRHRRSVHPRASHAASSHATADTCSLTATLPITHPFPPTSKPAPSHPLARSVWKGDVRPTPQDVLLPSRMVGAQVGHTRKAKDSVSVPSSPWMPLSPACEQTSRRPHQAPLPCPANQTKAGPPHTSPESAGPALPQLLPSGREEQRGLNLLVQEIATN